MTESFLPRVNGVTNSVCRILEQLAARSCEALVVAPTPGPGSYAGQPVVLMPAISLPMYPSFALGLPSRGVEAALRAFRPDVVHAASPILLGAAGITAARRLDVPSVAVFQTDVAGFARRHGFHGVDPIIWSWLRRVHARADRTLVPSSATMRQLKEHGVPRLAMWRRGVDAARFAPGQRDTELRARLAPDGEVLVGYVGRLSEDKRVHLLAELRDVPGIRLVVIGDGPAERELRRALPDAAFLGFLDGPALPAAMASLDVFVHTGRDETFCQTIQEALASGVPVVAPAAGGPLDLVAPGHTGLLYAPDDVDALRAAVVELAGDCARRVLMGMRGRDSVVGRSWESLADELLAHYAAVCGERAVDATELGPAPAGAGPSQPRVSVRPE